MLHHLTLWVPDLEQSERSWSWLLGELGYEVDRSVEQVVLLRHPSGFGVALEQSSDMVPGMLYSRMRPGLNHLAFGVESRRVLDSIAGAATDHGWSPFAGGGHRIAGGAHVAYLEDGDGFEVELVAPLDTRTRRRSMAPDRAFPMPGNLADATTRCDDEQQRVWGAGLPQTVDELARRWSIELGAPFQPGGRSAWVAPARRAGGPDLVLKVGRSHTEAAHEADALREWDGDGAVRLLASVELDDSIGLLIERCVPGTSLSGRPEPEQDLVLAALLRHLWRAPAPGHRYRTLQAMCDGWADEFDQRVARGHGRLDPGLARDGIAMFRALPATAPRQVLLCTDLHAGNVLAAAREPWLVIDPKPYVGDPTYDALQHLLNCEQRLLADPLGLVRRMAGLLELDGDRLACWLFARCVQESPRWPALAAVARAVAPG